MTSSLFRSVALYLPRRKCKRKCFHGPTILIYFSQHFALSLNDHLPQLPLAFACARHTQDILGAEQAMQVFHELKIIFLIISSSLTHHDSFKLFENPLSRTDMADERANENGISGPGDLPQCGSRSS